MNNQTPPTYAVQTAAALPIATVQDLQTLGQVLLQSELFGAKTPAQGLAIVAMCQQKRISWMDFMQNFHMIKGTVSKKTDAMLADLHRMGGTHKVVCRTPEKAECVFKCGESEYTSSITWEECLEEPFVYCGGKEDDIVTAIMNGHKWPNGKPLELKTKYRTPRSRKQMLWARCVSDGVRTVAPECCQGVYTPEEVSDFETTCTQIQSPTTGLATPAPSVPPVTVQGVASSSPLDMEVCPCGKFMGQRWDSLDTPVLQQALTATSPLITTEMKDHIRTVLAEREKSAPVAEQAETVEVSHV